MGRNANYIRGSPRIYRGLAADMRNAIALKTPRSRSTLLAAKNSLPPPPRSCPGWLSLDATDVRDQPVTGRKADMTKSTRVTLTGSRVCECEDR